MSKLKWWQRALDNWLTRRDLGHLIQHVGEDIHDLAVSINVKLEKQMADAAAILAAVTANTDVLKSVAVAADGLKEGQADIAAEIAALKAQIGVQADLGPLETAVAEQGKIIDGLKTAVGSNTPAGG